MDTETKLDELDKRVRILENGNTELTGTLTHLSKSFDEFILKSDAREERENARFNRLTNIAYFGMGSLAVIQFLVSNGHILGAK